MIKLLKLAGEWDELQFFFFQSESQGQNLGNNVKKLSKIVQYKKTLVSILA